MSDTCGKVKDSDGEPCELPDCRPDGRCWYHTEHEDLQANGGRPSKLSLDMQEEIAQAIENGKSIVSASRMAGINPATFHRWMEDGEAQDAGPYRDFYERIVRARGYGENFYVDLLLDLAEDDEATVMSMLKQRYPESWGDVKRGEQAGGSLEVHLPENAVKHERRVD